MTAAAASPVLSPRGAERPPLSESRQRARRKARILRAIWYVGVSFVAIVTVAPLIWTVSTSIKPAGEVLARALELIPAQPTFDNYIEAVTTVPFARYFFNSMVLAVGGTLTNLFFGSLGGYALARLRFRGRNAVFGVFLSSLMIPGIVTMIPSFLILRHFPLVGGNDLLGQGGLGFINSYWAVILPGAAGAFAVFFMKQFFESLPAELAEAARIDGASEFRIFWQVYLPLAKAGLAVLGIFSFQAGWNSFLWPLLVLNDQQMMTVQVGLASFVNNYNESYGPLMAGTIIASLPVLILFIVAQRYIIEGIAHVGAK